MSEELFDKSKDNQIRENGLIMNTDEVVDLLNSQSKLISAYMYEFAKMSKENKQLKEENEMLIKQKRIVDKFLYVRECECERLEEENEQLLHKLQQIKEYLQTKIDECKNHKKMKEIVFGVEQAVGYEKALLQFQKGLKRRLNDE